MPELPEVESARRLVHAHCVGLLLEDIVTLEQGGGPRDGHYDDIVCTSSLDLFASLRGRTLTGTGRKGKLQWLSFSKGGGSSSLHLFAHFGMTGAFSVQGSKGPERQTHAVDTSSWPPKFCKLELVFVGGVRLAFTDPRRLARATVYAGADPAKAPAVTSLGPDAWLELPAPPALGALLSARATCVKAILLDQSILSGVGNWIADEVLFQASIHPETAGAALSPSDVARLHDALVFVINTAVNCDSDADKFPADWLFNHRWGKGKGVSKLPDGRAISFVTVGGRTSAVVVAKQGKPRKTPYECGVESAGASAGAGTGKKRKAAKSVEVDEEATATKSVPTDKKRAPTRK